MQLKYQVDGEPLEQLPNGYSDHYVPGGFVRGGLFMLEHFFKSLVATVSDPYQCNRITDALAAAGIKFYCKTKDVNRRNTFDQARIGTLGIKPQYVTEVFVDKENANMALHIIHTLS